MLAGISCYSYWIGICLAYFQLYCKYQLYHQLLKALQEHESSVQMMSMPHSCSMDNCDIIWTNTASPSLACGKAVFLLIHRTHLSSWVWRDISSRHGVDEVSEFSCIVNATDLQCFFSFTEHICPVMLHLLIQRVFLLHVLPYTGVPC
jgi:hypothetical protein